MRLFLPLVLVVLFAACAGPGSVSPDEQFGHRYEGVAPDGRETVLIEAADSSAVYIELPVYIDSVHVRPARTILMYSLQFSRAPPAVIRPEATRIPCTAHDARAADTEKGPVRRSSTGNGVVSVYSRRLVQQGLVT